MPEFHNNLWAPWRMEYIRSLDQHEKAEGCFLCGYRDTPEQDAENHVLWRTQSSFVVMNRFPYTNGHLLVAPTAHKPDLAALTDEELLDLSKAIRNSVAILQETVRAQGFNIGYNFGLCAGAGLPDHLHAHVVPRWAGDTNFMPVLGDTRVIPDSLDALAAELCKAAEHAGFRS